SSSCSSSHKGLETSTAAGMMPFHGAQSPGICSMLLTLCWETQQTFLRPHEWMCHPEELDNLCSLIGMRGPPHAPSSDKDTAGTQN
ncbi:Hypothetical protein SMAX5B_013697, partial [Scophthalmus maximus]